MFPVNVFYDCATPPDRQSHDSTVGHPSLLLQKLSKKCFRLCQANPCLFKQWSNFNIINTVGLFLTVLMPLQIVKGLCFQVFSSVCNKCFWPGFEALTCLLGLLDGQSYNKMMAPTSMFLITVKHPLTPDDRFA